MGGGVKVRVRLRLRVGVRCGQDALRVCRFAISHARRWCSSTTDREVARGVSFRAVAQPPWACVARAVSGRLGAPLTRAQGQGSTVGVLHRIVQVVYQLVQTLQLALRPASNAVPSTDLLEHRRADAKRRCGPSRGWGRPWSEALSDPQGMHVVWSFDVKKRTCDVDDGPVEQRRDLLNA